MSDLTDKEIEQYDRQIRLWGVDAQRRMRDARVIVLGVNALGAEVVKNLLLAGVNVTLVDDVIVAPVHLEAHLFLREQHVGLNVSRWLVSSAVFIFCAVISSPYLLTYSPPPPLLPSPASNVKFIPCSRIESSRLSRFITYTTT